MCVLETGKAITEPLLPCSFILLRGIDLMGPAYHNNRSTNFAPIYPQGTGRPRLEPGDSSLETGDHWNKRDRLRRQRSSQPLENLGSVESLFQGTLGAALERGVQGYSRGAEGQH
ncbi:hypothetical protein ElyMa_000043600 [Elysia marginata]|uniref:Uncharacterized protein n=1 Tax=Elysia marginata TaxID=1093978 RepID=A0AAV4ECZ0_9GAST|nr:hypothetical protein ElyMa_000043600 [Elysia marginata]